MRKSKLPDYMYGVGFLGHTWAVSYTTESGEDRLQLQCDSAESCVRCYDEHDEKGRAAQIWRRDGKSWKKVSRSLAMIN